MFYRKLYAECALLRRKPRRFIFLSCSPIALVGALALLGVPARQAVRAQDTTISAPPFTTLRLQKSLALRGEFVYWFTNMDRDMSSRLPLPASAPDGSLTLSVPADFRQPDALLNVLDVKRNLIARLPLSSAMEASASEGEKPLGPNLLQNGDFTQQAGHWNPELNTGKASAGVQWPTDAPVPPGASGSVARFTVEAIDSLPWHAQYSQPGLDFREGEAYTVSFWAKADRNRPLTVLTSVDQRDYHHLGLNSRVQLRPQWRRITLPFIATTPVPDHGRLVFVLGEALGRVDIADVRVQQGITAHTLGPNLLQNARFEEGAAHWIPLQTTAPAQGVSQIVDTPASTSGPHGKALHIQISAPGTEIWHIHTGQGGLNLEEEGIYTLTLWAKSDTGRRLALHTDLDGPDYHYTGLDETLPLTSAWRKFTLVFAANDTQGGKARLIFTLGGQAGSLDIADLALQSGAAAPPPAAAPVPTLTRESFTVAYKPVPSEGARGDAKAHRSHPLVGTWQSFHKDVGLTGKEYQRYRFVFDPNGTGSLQVTTLTENADAPPKSQQKETFKWQLVEGGPHVSIGSNVYTWGIEKVIEKDGMKQKLTLKNYEGKTYILFRQ